MGVTFSHPFRLSTNGSVATVDDKSDPGISQDIAALILTHLSERPLAPSFGIPDPAFSGVEPSQLAAGMSQFGPGVQLTDIEITNRNAQTMAIRVTYNEEAVSNGQS